MARVRVLTMKFPRVTKIGQSIASMLTTPQVSGLGPVTVYIARFKCRAGLDPDRAYLFQLGSAHQKVAPGRARSTRLHCHLFCRAVLDPGRALSICGSVNVAIVCEITTLYRVSVTVTSKWSQRKLIISGPFHMGFCVGASLINHSLIIFIRLGICLP